MTQRTGESLDVDRRMPATTWTEHWVARNSWHVQRPQGTHGRREWIDGWMARRVVLLIIISVTCSVLLLAVLDPTVGSAMEVLSPFFSVLCHSDRLFHVLVLSIQAVCGFLASVHLALFLAFSLSPGNFLVSSWCDHSVPVFLL